jgi:predicted PurR-regulated permease PerM
MARTDSSFAHARVLILAGVVVVVAGLYLARDLLIPLALAILLSFLLAPVAHRFERWRFGRIPSVAASVGLSTLLIAGMGWIVANQFLTVAYRLPEYQDNIREKFVFLRAETEGRFTRASETLKRISEDLETQPAAEAEGPSPAAPPETEPVRVAIVERPLSVVDYLRDHVPRLLHPLVTAGIVFVLVIFMLLQRDDLRDRVIRLIGQGRIHLTTQAIDEAGRRISRYLLMQLIVNATYGLPVALGLWIVGLPGALLWGLMATLVRFIPYLGPWLGALPPIALSVAVFDTWPPTLVVIGMFITLEIISNNFMEPWLYGVSTGMSPVAVLLAAVFWAWLWGPVGLLLATPLTACLVVLGKFVPQLEFMTIIFGNQPALKPSSRFYQRLVALDQEEASEMVEAHLAKGSLVEVYDDLLLPALHLAEHDRHQGRLDPRYQEFILESMREIIEEIAEERREGVAQAEIPPVAPPVRSDGPPVLCLPARDEADEIAANMLTQLLAAEGLPTRVLSVEHLTSEMLDQVAESNAWVVCISALPPAATLHVRYLCKRLGARFPQATLVVGLWNTRADTRRIRERLRCTGDVRVVITFADALEQIRLAMQSRLLRTPPSSSSSPPPRTDAALR